MRGDLIETYEMIIEISNSRQFFNISPWTGNLLSRQISKTKSPNQLNFLGNKEIYIFLNCLINKRINFI